MSDANFPPFRSEQDRLEFYKPDSRSALLAELRYLEDDQRIQAAAFMAEVEMDDVMNAQARARHAPCDPLLRHALFGLHLYPGYPADVERVEDSSSG